MTRTGMTCTGMTRWAELDRAKGLAIILVVFGHLVAREDPAGVAWYGPLRMVIYLFHMPFFFYLSGYVAVLSGGLEKGARLRQRATRLLLPFLGFGIAILLGKLLLAPVAAVDNVPVGFGAGLWALLWDTGRSPATSVWYLAALFVFSVALPALLRALGITGLLALGLALFVLPVPPVAYLDRVCGYFIFFAAGVAAARAGVDYLTHIDRWRGPLLAVFAALLILAWSGIAPVLGGAQGAWLLGLGLLAMPALHALMRFWPAPALAWLGAQVLPIYLLNTICIGLTKALLLPVLGWRANSFAVFAVALMAAGLFAPILIARILSWAAPAVQRQFLR